ncbi:uncharacterized protein LOC103313767 [Tribolium castaneum]|uniref:Uncharacterized protein n=1 Tax=Tribolium castaneum TaxID=7070 RepID=D6WYP6_TRICA|nr:hypothetical protein TcasGA2_TC006091 [Tribolium castaneum]
MKITLSLILLVVCTLAKGLALPQELLDATGEVFSPRKDENILGLKATREQLGEEKYKKVLDLLRAYLNGLKDLPKIDFGNLSEMGKLEKALGNKDVKHVIMLLKDFIVGVQELQGNAGEIATPTVGGNPATDSKST